MPPCHCISFSPLQRPYSQYSSHYHPSELHGAQNAADELILIAMGEDPAFMTLLSQGSFMGRIIVERLDKDDEGGVLGSIVEEREHVRDVRGWGWGWYL